MGSQKVQWGAESLWPWIVWLVLSTVFFPSSLTTAIKAQSIQVPWPVWLSWLGIILQNKITSDSLLGHMPGCGFKSLVRVHTRRQLINVSLSHWCFNPSLYPALSPLSKNKINKVFTTICSCNFDLARKWLSHGSYIPCLWPTRTVTLPIFTKACPWVLKG